MAAPAETPADAWRTAVENRLGSTNQRLERLEGKIDRYFILGIVAIAGVAIEGFWMYTNMNEKLVNLQLAVNTLTGS